MAAQGFLLIASFILLLMILARPLGAALATMINDAPLPGGGHSFAGDELVSIFIRYSAV